MKTKKTASFIIFIILYMAYTSIYAARLNLSTAKPALELLGRLSTTQLAAMGSVFSLVYSVGRIINGTIGDRVKPYIMVATGLTLAGISNIIIGFFPPFTAMLISWGVNAFAQSMLWSSILCIISVIYDERTAKKKTTLMVTSVATGNILGIALTSLLIKFFDVRFAFIIPGTITLILCIFVILSTNNISLPLKETAKNHIPPVKLLLNKSILIMILPTMIHGAMKDNISLFMVDYFSKTFLIDPTKNPLYVIFIPVIGFIGRIAYPMLFKLCRFNEHKVSSIGFILCALSALPLCFLKNAVVSTVALGAIYAFVSIINTSMLSVFPMQFSKQGNVASVSGIMDFLTYFGHSVSSMIYGITIVTFGYKSMYFSWIILSLLALSILLAFAVNKGKE